MRKIIAFTITEILVCIAIASVIIAITASYLISSRDKARQTVCLSNMRQIHSAVAMYRQDYDGGDTGNSVSDFGLPRGIAGLPQWGYIKNANIMWCPNRELTPFGRDLKNKGSLWSYEDYSIYKYYYNFPKKYHEDKKWPLFICSFEDVNFVRSNPATTPNLVSAITLDGTVYRFDYKKIGASGNEVLDDIYK